MKKRNLIVFIVIDILVISGFLIWFFLFRVQAGNYKSNVLDLGLHFSAKNFCSCYFVAGQSEEACRDYVGIEQVKPTVTFDTQSKKVSARFLVFSAEAQYQSAPEGCVFLD